VLAVTLVEMRKGRKCTAVKGGSPSESGVKGIGRMYRLNKHYISILFSCPAVFFSAAKLFRHFFMCLSYQP
jgi:hypothetical protein